MRALKLLLVVMLMAPATIEAQVRMRPGQYEYTFEVDVDPARKAAMDAILGAAGGGGPNQKQLQCVTAEDVKDMTDAAGIVKVFTRDIEEDGNCKVSDVKTTSNTLAYTATCVEDGSRMTMTTELRFSGDVITGSTKGKSYDGRPIDSKMTARRVGECPK